MKVFDLLNIPLLNEARVVAGSLGTSHEVEWVDMMDAPDIAEFLKPNEILLTTAYLIKDDPTALMRLIEEMKEHECAALCLKTKRFLAEIPDAVKQHADKLGFTVIEIPFEVDLAEALHQILSFILNSKTEELRYAMEMHKQFAGLILHGQGLSAISKNLSMILKQPTIIVDGQLCMWDAVKLAHGTRRDSIHDGMLSALTERLEDTPQLPPNSSVPYVSSTGVVVSIYSVQTDLRTGYIVSLGQMQERDTFITLALEQAATIVAFELIKQHAIEEQSRRMKNEFFAVLLDGEMSSETEILLRGKQYGLTEGAHYACMAGKIDESTEVHHRKLIPEKSKIEFQKNAVYDLITRLIISHDFHAVLFTKGDLYVLLTTFQSYDVLEQALPEFARTMQQEIEIALQISISFGIGNAVSRMGKIPASFSEAFENLQSGYREGNRKFVRSYRAKELMDLIGMIPVHYQREFCQNSLKDLADPQNGDDFELIQTLTSYFNNNFHITATARELYVHPNTVKYRLAKCQEKLSWNVHDAGETLCIRMALLIRPLI